MEALGLITIPSRAAKLGSIAVDKGIAKLGSPGVKLMVIRHMRARPGPVCLP